MNIAEKLTAIGENQHAIYGAGKRAEYDAFWDVFQTNGNRTNYQSAFTVGWDDTNYNPKYPIIAGASGGLVGVFASNAGITDTKVPITAYGSCQAAFSYAKVKKIPKIIFTTDVTNVTYMFNSCNQLEEMYCEGTIAITGIDLHWSTKLNKASILSIINVLDDVVHEGTDADPTNKLTLSLTAVNNAFYQVPTYNEYGDIEVEECVGSESHEWNALVADKSNWSIVLI